MLWGQVGALWKKQRFWSSLERNLVRNALMSMWFGV
jgi:hypothetical protein